MQRFKNIINKVIYPGWIITILLVCVSAILLIYTFVSCRNDTLVAYLVYCISAYTLIVICCKTPGLVKRGKRLVYENPYSGRYLSDVPYRISISLYWSIIINFAFAVIKMISGLLYSSVWFGAIALYYVILCLIRFYLLLQIKGRQLGQNKSYEYQRYRLCGIFLLTLNLALSGVVIQMVRLGQGSRYPGMLIYAAALYAFYAIITAATNIVRYRKYDSPLISATKAINFTTAAVAILFLQTAMLAEFGGSSLQFQKFINVVTSCAVCLITLGTALYMIINGNKGVRKYGKEEHRNV